VKRLILIASLALGLCGLGAPVATPAAPSDAQGPACGNIVDGDGSYTGIVGAEGTVDFTIQLADSACSIVTYSFFVTDTSGGAITPTGAVTQDANCGSGIAAPCVHFVYNIASSPDTVCVYATTMIKGHLVDRAPNASDTFCPASSPSLSAKINGGVGASGNFG
jgi:hypothetical protein